ncbi:subtype I-B CRISPR-associated endonuclease Cas1 [candidate division WOR-3 bacterium]|uniref:CRISPR-associated endonuclease Cas1 n=1 Tax=candidate division WOR-3 bacterium TaxID=2052148 RepID=A0A660SGE7_UNCW3|nr:MAG: subtype I-B CRISPR-associated endonuclease Cas1 [candidate division WOR-3 bacterium]
MKRSIYIFSSGEIHRKQNTLYFQLEDGRRKYIPVENTRELLIFGEVSINKKLLEFLSQKEIILHFFNHYGYYVGSYYPREHYNSGHMILKQAEFYLDHEKRIDLARRFVSGAIANIKKVLNYYKNRGVEVGERLDRIEHLEETIPAQEDTDELMAIEGNAREVYYGAFNLIINNEEFEFGTRSRRPPRNRLNALISFGNSLLYTAALSEIYKTHLDPRIGFLHTCNFRRFTLNLDVAEIFKPIIVDRIIFTLINKEMIKPKHFVEEAGGIFMDEKGRKIFVEEFDRRMETTIRHQGLGRNVSYRRLILLELYKIEKHLLGDKPYEPFVSRW